MPSSQLVKTLDSYENYIEKKGIDTELIKAYSMATMASFDDKEAEHYYSMHVAKRCKELIDKYIATATNGGNFGSLETYCQKHDVWYEVLDNYYDVLKCEAPYLFDSYMLYLEKNRLEKDRFYKPRRKCFVKTGLIQALQDIEDDKYELMSISMPPGVGKTTYAKFFTTWIIGRHLDDYNLFYSHSGDITRMFYDGIYEITTNSQEYTWSEIFPQAKLQSTNAKSEKINFGKNKPFSSIQCTSVGSKNSGKVRISERGYLICDDLIGGIEEALNKNILDKLWSIYAVDARQRKKDGSKEIHIATRWSVHDVIGRLQAINENNSRTKFIAVPDIDPVTQKSNFMFDIDGFSEEFYKSQELIMDDISYRCLYKNDPIEREGLLYHDDDLRRYISLPLQEPDAILSICDTKTTGADYMVLPVFYKYGEDYYLVDTICDNSSDFGLQQARLANILIDHNVQQCEFESNAGGGRLAKEVSDIVASRGGRCNITTKPTESNKETRIIVNSDWIKKHCLFKDKDNYTRKSDYGEFMYWLLSYSVTGKNPHDDVPDALANFALYCTKELRVARAEAVHNPFRSGFYGGLL